MHLYIIFKAINRTIMIPKHIYQTWKTKNLHPNVQQVRNQIQQLNPDYTMHLYDDDDMLLFLRENYAPNVITAFQMLAVGAAKADLWRYCILYTHGGVYLDIDAKITDSLDTLINYGNRGIITGEGNPGIFCQWIMLFEPRHPFLYMMIENCVKNIFDENKKRKIKIFSHELTKIFKLSKLAEDEQFFAYFYKCTDSTLYTLHAFYSNKSNLADYLNELHIKALKLHETSINDEKIFHFYLVSKLEQQSKFEADTCMIFENIFS